MKLTTPVLLISVAANLALATVLINRAPRADPLSTLPSVGSHEKPTENPTPQVIPITSATWTTLAAGSARDFATRLHDEGFPPSIIRLLLAERINSLFAERLRAFRPKNKDSYWNSQYGEPINELSTQDRAARRALRREMDEALKRAMGDGYESLDPDERAARSRNFGQLPSDKVAQIKALDSDYNELSELVDEPLLPEDRDQLRLLAKEKRADLVALLTPAELLEYDLRSSPSAFRITRKLSNFNSTEQEYRALTLVQLEFDRQYGTDNLSTEEKNRRREAEKQLDAQFQSVLTPERRAEYQLVTDPSYQPTSNFTHSFNYDAKITRQIVSLQRSITQRAEAIRQQSPESAASRDAGLNLLQREASAQLSSMLSAAAYEAYQKDDAGRWLSQLKSLSAQPGLPLSS